MISPAPTPGCSPALADGRRWQQLGRAYLENFYKTMQKHPDKIAVGGAWPGFDDSAAKWVLTATCKVLRQTLDQNAEFLSALLRQLQAASVSLIETWNDYEEGTAIERRTATECGGDAGSQSSHTK